MRKRAISLRTFKNILLRCWQEKGGAKGMVVRFYLGDKELVIKRIGQFGIVPDVTIEFEVMG